jgi:hypothetical protein
LRISSGLISILTVMFIGTSAGGDESSIAEGADHTSFAAEAVEKLS